MINSNKSRKSPAVQPKCAAVVLQDEFARFAVSLRRSDQSLQEDLVQEMSLGVLQCTESHTLSFFRSRALSRAKDFLKSWQRKSQEGTAGLAGIPQPRTAENDRSAEWYMEKINALMALDPEPAGKLPPLGCDD